MPPKAKQSAPKSDRQCEKRGENVKRITYDYKRGEPEHPHVAHKRQTRDDEGRLVWRKHLITLESLEAFVRRFPVLCSFTDMRLVTQTMKMIEGVGFAKGTPRTLHEVVFSMQKESTPPAERYEFEDFVERSLETGKETVLKRIRFDLSINLQALWTIASQYDIDLKRKKIKNGSGWWAHSVRLMARYQWWTFFGTDNWTQRTPNNEHLHEQHKLLPEKECFKNMGYFHFAHYEKLEGSINDALKWQGLQPRKRPFDLSRLVNKPPKANGALQTALVRKRKTDQAEESAKRQRREEEEEAAREAERESRRQQKRRTREKNVSTRNVSTKRVKDEQTEEPEEQKHNTVYLFKVIPEVTSTAPGAVRFSVENGWFEKEFSDMTSAKMGVTGKDKPTERERCLNAKFGVTHVLDQYVHLRDDVKKEDVEKLLFENVKVKGACHLKPLEPSTEHFFFKHDAKEGFKDEEAMNLFRTVFFDTVRPYVDFEGEERRLLSADAESIVYESP